MAALPHGAYFGIASLVAASLMGPGKRARGVALVLSGVIVVEVAFAYKGFGSLILEAALNQDVYLLEAATLVAVLVAVSTQMLADIGYTLLNPRIRFK